MNSIKILADKHHKISVQISRDLLNAEGKLLSQLMEMKRLKLFPVLNYSGIFDYCERALGLSRSQSYYFKSVAEKSLEVLEVKQAVIQGELTLSEARRITPVVTPDNKGHWIDLAKSLSQAELERAVTSANPKARKRDRLRPIAQQLSELRVTVDVETEEKLKTLQNLLSQKNKKAATLGEVIAWASRVCLEKVKPEKETRRKVSSGNKPKVGRHSIPVSLKREVMRRDGGFRCGFKSLDGRRCDQKRWLEFHHVVPVSRGGLNTVENLTILCRGHHELRH